MRIASPKFIGWSAIILSVVTACVVFYTNSARRHTPLIFSAKGVLSSTWAHYKDEYLEKGTYRTLDKQQDNITTSEGESYTMLRAVWEDDQDAFDKSWKWTKDILQHTSGDHLMAWLFGKREDGSYGVIISKGGGNTASDADSDIALALLFAHGRWNKQEYLDAAKAIISDIWTNEVVTIKGTPYLAANNIEKANSEQIVVNPSYLAPYAYRIFAKVDPLHPWGSLVDSSYAVIEKSITSNLDASSSAEIPPDWIRIDRNTGVMTAPLARNLSTHYSFDALRVPWRLAVDYLWNDEPRAQKLLAKMKFLSTSYAREGSLYSTYRHDGQILRRDEAPAMYGGSVGYFLIADPARANDLYQKKLISLFNPDTESWRVKLSYYDDNWVWFGIALYNNLLPQLYEQK